MLGADCQDSKKHPTRNVSAIFVYIFEKNIICRGFAAYLSLAPLSPRKPWSSCESVWPQHKLGGMEEEEQSILARANKYSLC